MQHTSQTWLFVGITNVQAVLQNNISGGKVLHAYFYNSSPSDVMQSQDWETLGHLEIPLENVAVLLSQDDSAILPKVILRGKT